MNDIVIFGVGGMGREIIGLIENINKVSPSWNIIGFLDDNKSYWGKLINGHEVLGGFQWLEKYNNKIYLTCGIGDSKIRKLIYEKSEKLSNIELATLVDPTAYINNSVIIEKGSIICRNCTINIDAIIGRGILMNTSSSVGHDSILSDYCTLFTNTIVSGNSKIGENCEIGSGAFILQGKNIAGNSVIAPLSAVLKDIEEPGIYSGNPARRFK